MLVIFSDMRQDTDDLNLEHGAPAKPYAVIALLKQKELMRIYEQREFLS